MKRIVITKKCGNAEIGTVFIQGLHGTPEWDTWQGKPPEFFYWKEGTTKEDNAFLWETALWGENEDGTTYSYADVIDHH